MATELMVDCVLVLCTGILICMARELIDSWRNYGEQ